MTPEYSNGWGAFSRRRQSESLRESPQVESAASTQTIIPWLRRVPVAPCFALAAIGIAVVCALPSGHGCLMAVGLTAAFFIAGTILLALRLLPEAIAVNGLLLCLLVHAIGLALLCIWGLRGDIYEFTPYTILIGAEIQVLLFFLAPPLALLCCMASRIASYIGKKPTEVADDARVAADKRMIVFLICAAAFTLMFWVGAELSMGVLKVIFETLQRSFFFVAFLAGFHFRVSRIALITWLLAVVLGVLLGIATGSRGPAFLPVFLFGIGLFAGASFRQRLILVVVMAVMAVPLFYAFSMVEVIRTDMGRLRVSEISADTIRQVAKGIGEKSKFDTARDSYEEIPSTARSVIRLVNWPNLAVAAIAGGGGSYRGYADLPDQIRASANVVVLTGSMDSYYVAGLYNLRASDYGFRVDEGTSVEFGVFADAWDRGGFLGALVYAFVAIVVLAGTEKAVRALLKNSPALTAIMVSTMFASAFWTMNTYNLPLSLRQLGVNLLVCVFVFGGINLVLGRGQEGTVDANRSAEEPSKMPAGKKASFLRREVAR